MSLDGSPNLETPRTFTGKTQMPGYIKQTENDPLMVGISAYVMTIAVKPVD